MPEELVGLSLKLPSGELSLLQPAEAAALPDAGAIEWAPIVPYWAVLWRSGVALARELDGAVLAGRRVVELGCGLGIPSLVAARDGAEVLATDAEPEALALLERNARANGIELATDVLYARESAALPLSLLPRLGAEAWIAEPGRPPADAFLEQARRRWRV